MSEPEILRGVRAVVFDMDGVILESTDIKTEAFLELFADYPAQRVAILGYHLSHLGISRYDKFAWIYRELLNKPFPESERARLGERFFELAMEKVLACPFVPGAVELLNELYGKKRLFVASGTPQEELDVILERRGIGKYFEGAWGAPSKKPDTIRYVMKEYALTPEQVLMIGDGSTDYDAARETGVRFLARETAETREAWRMLKVERVEDLRGLV